MREVNGSGQIPVMRIRERVDTLTAGKDYAQAARLLDYWRAEARALGDGRGEFVVLNEMMGVYRKMGDQEKAKKSALEAIALIGKLENGDTISAGTAYVNAGTVFDFCREPQKAVEYFEEARKIYEKSLPDSDERLGGLYNNLAIALSDLGRYEEAFSYWERALFIMGQQPHGGLEQAISYLNMANACEAMKGLEEAEEDITSYLERAEGLLKDPSIPQNGYYAFVCEKCAPTFSYYGWFLTAKELQDTAEQIQSRYASEE